MNPLAFSNHNHGHCITDAVRAVEAHCTSAGLRLTPVRRRVLEILLNEHRAMRAYDILEKLSAEGFGSQPPLVYRALEFLVANGFVHRIERINAFVACVHPQENHAPAFLVCRGCDAVAEAPGLATDDAIDQIATATNFAVERVVIEAEGLCPSCQEGAPQ